MEDKRLRVIHLIGGGDTGGAKTHVLNLLKELGTHADTEIVCFMRGDFSEEAQEMGIPIHVIESGNLLTQLRELKKVIAKFKVDILHCHGARGLLMGLLSRRYAKAPVVSTVHSDYRLDYLGRPFAKLTYGAIYTFDLRRANYYIGVSDPMTDILIDRGFPPEKIYTIYNGIDFDTPITYKSREDFFRSVDFPVNQDDVVAGIVARLSPVKDIPTLLRAMAIACKKMPNLKLAIAGDGEDREKLIALAKTLGIAEKVCFAGWITDINSFYNAIDINLLTSISETFPYALTEGCRMKLPTIASRVGGVPVLIDDGLNGLIFEPQDEAQLAAHLVTLTANASLRETMGQRLYKKASEKFSISTMVQEQMRIYTSILNREARKKKKRDGIVICGAYGHGNAGDNAILQSIMASIHKIDPDMPVTILAKDPQAIGKMLRVKSIYTFNIPAVMRVMRHTQLYINGGGSLIQNVTSNRSLWYYLSTLSLAKFLRNKVVMYGCGIGPINGDKNVRQVVRVLNRHVDTITLRENQSRAELAAYGVDRPKIEVTSDPAIVLRPCQEDLTIQFMKRHSLDPNGKYACFILRSWKGFSKKTQAIAESVDYLYETYGITPLFIPINVYHDTEAAHMVTSKFHAPCVVIHEEMESEMLISLLSRMELVVSMRLHGLIFSAISGVPLVGISYDPKVNAFIDYLGYGTCMNLKNVTKKHLCSALDKAAGQSGKKQQLKVYAQRLAEKEHQNIKAVQELLDF